MCSPNEHIRMYFLRLLHRVFVCVCVFSLMLSLCFTFNLGLHCKQIHSPDGGAGRIKFRLCLSKTSHFFFPLPLWPWLQSRSGRVRKLPKWSGEVTSIMQELAGSRMFARMCSPSWGLSTARGSMAAPGIDSGGVKSPFQPTCAPLQASTCGRIVCKDAVIEDPTTLVTFLSNCAITLSVENASSLDSFTLYFCSGMNE